MRAKKLITREFFKQEAGWKQEKQRALTDGRTLFLFHFYWFTAKQVLGKRLEVPSKSIEGAVLKGRECRPEVKTASMSVKTKTMFIKSKALIDKSVALSCVFQTFCVSLNFVRTYSRSKMLKKYLAFYSLIRNFAFKSWHVFRRKVWHYGNKRLPLHTK